MTGVGSGPSGGGVPDAALAGGSVGPAGRGAPDVACASGSDGTSGAQGCPSTGAPAGTSSGALRLAAGALGAAAFGFAVLAPAVFVKPVTETSEARVACAARNMIRSGDWVVPRLYEDMAPRLQKPPLAYWAAAACALIFFGGHVSEAAVALPSAAFGALTCAIVWLFVRRRVGAGAAFVAVCSLSTSEAFFLSGHVGSADMALAFFATAATLLAARRAVFGEGRMPSALLAGVCIGLGWLAKGPNVLPPVLLPWLVFAASDIVRRRRFDAGTARWFAWALAAALLAAAPWHLAVAARVPGTVSAGILELGAHLEGTRHAKPFYFYILYIPYRFLPWTPAALLWGAAALARRRANGGGAAGNAVGGAVENTSGYAAGTDSPGEAGDSVAGRMGGAAAGTGAGPTAELSAHLGGRARGSDADPGCAGEVREIVRPTDDSSCGIPHRSPGALSAFFGTAAIGTAIIYSIITDKRDYYVLPIFPALAILAGIWSESAAGPRGVFGRAAGMCVAIPGVAFGAFVALAPAFATSADLWPPGIGMFLGIALALAALAAAWSFRAGSPAGGAGHVALAAALCYWAYSGWYYSKYRRENPVRLLAATAESLAPRDAPIYVSGEPFAIMLYYFDRPITGLGRIAETWPRHAWRGALFAGTMEAAEGKLGLARTDVLAVVSRKNLPSGREYVVARLAPGADWPGRYRKAIESSGKRSKRQPARPTSEDDPDDL